MGEFVDALKYPFKKWYTPLLITVLFFIPILGWLAIAGYLVRVYANVGTGKKDELPNWEGVADLFKDGVFLMLLGLVMGGLVALIPYVGVLVSMALAVFYAQVFAKKGKEIGERLNIIDTMKLVIDNIGEFIFYLIKLVGVMIVFGLASLPIITIPFTLPSIGIASAYLAAGFYYKSTKKINNKEMISPVAPVT